MNQPVATYTEGDFERLIKYDYLAELHEEVRATLDEYGRDKWQPYHLHVRMACLKLAGGNLADLRRYVRSVFGDYRDILALAEYPAYMRGQGPAEQKMAIKQD